MTGTSKIYEVKKEIEAMIRKGKFPLGKKLPSEPELAEEFNVSRGTIRQVLGELAQEAIVSRRSGAGTTVMRVPTKTAQIMAFRDQIEAAGLKPRTEVLAQDRILASEANGRVCEAFLLDPENVGQIYVYRIDRLRYGGDKPVARQIVYLLTSDFKQNLLDGHDFSTSLYTLYQRYHRRVVWADEIIQARPATLEEVDMFKMDDTPTSQQFVYERNRISYDQENRVLEVMTSIDRGDFFKGYQYRIVEENLWLLTKHQKRRQNNSKNSSG